MAMRGGLRARRVLSALCAPNPPPRYPFTAHSQRLSQPSTCWSSCSSASSSSSSSRWLCSGASAGGWRQSSDRSRAAAATCLATAAVGVVMWSRRERALVAETAADEHAPKASKHYNYVLIAHPRAVVAQSALQQITQYDPDAKVLVVADKYNMDETGTGSRIYTANVHDYYKINRMPEKAEAPKDKSHRENITSFTMSKSKLDPKMPVVKPVEEISDNIEVCKTAYAVLMDPDNKTVELSDGTVVSFGKCLLATGCREGKMPGVPDSLKSHVTNLRKVKDFDRVHSMVSEGKVQRIVVVGGGFLGCEVATKLASAGKEKGVEVVHAYVEPGALYRYVPVYFSDYVTERLRGFGVQERPYTMVLSMGEAGDRTHNLQLVMQGFEKTILDCGHVVFAPTHLEGNVELAKRSGLEIDGKCGGVMVNSEMVARTDIYVAGDTASYPDRVLGRRRMQSFDHSFHSGILAGSNMALGQRQAYNHLPVITSAGGPLDLDIVVLGDIDSNMEMYSIAQMEHSEEQAQAVLHQWEKWEKGIVYYLRDRRVVGAMLINVTERTDDVRRLIRSGLKYRHRTEQGIPELEEAIQLGLVNATCRHSSAKGVGLMRSASGEKKP